jgi:Phage Mu protein F like protein
VVSPEPARAGSPPAPAEAWAKLQRAQARKLLDVEHRTLVTTRSDVTAVVGSTQVELARQPDRSHAELLALLMLASHRMRGRVAKRIREGRTQARLAAIGRIRAELTLAGVALAVTHALEPRTSVDAAHSDAVATSFSAAWAAAALYLVSKAEREETSRIVAIDAATDAADFRIRRIAGTEIPRAYNDQHRKDAEEIAEIHPDVMREFARKWDAMLDRRTCQTCRSLDGETAPIGESFRGGYEPGEVHALCRCMSTLVPMSETMRSAA